MSLFACVACSRVHIASYSATTAYSLATFALPIPHDKQVIEFLRVCALVKQGTRVHRDASINLAYAKYAAHAVRLLGRQFVAAARANKVFNTTHSAAAAAS